jgi:cbb3-type cytochrome oxidase cytochrome c subunit
MTQKNSNFSRRNFIKTTSAVAVAGSVMPAYAFNTKSSTQTGKLAALGGEPVRSKKFPGWPYRDNLVMDQIKETTESGIW